MTNWSCYMKDALTNINLIKSRNKLIHVKSGICNLQNILIGVDKTAWVKRGKKTTDLLGSFGF